MEATNEPPPWPQPDHHSQPPHQPTEDDFANFLDLENMDFPFMSFNEDGSAVAQHAHQQQQQQQLHQQQPHAQTPIDRDPGIREADQHRQIQQQHHQQNQWNLPKKDQFAQQRQPLTHAQIQQARYNVQQGIPPGIPQTPTSAEMFPHPGAGYLQNSHSMRRDDMVRNVPDSSQAAAYAQQNLYTPNMTPDVTAGSESATSYVPEYAVPGTYHLSPLTSPAMRPQNQNGYHHGHAQTSTAASSLAASPVDLSFDHDASSGGERPRKTRKKADGASATSTPNTPARSGKRRLSQVKNQTKRPVQLDTTRGNGEPGSQPSSGNLNTLASSRDGSSKSVSPRPLDEARMAPPPKPHPQSAGPIARDQRRPEQIQTGLPPATPASLMRLRTQASNGSLPSPSAQSVNSPLSGGVSDAGIGFLALPEAATPVEALNGRVSKHPLSPAVCRTPTASAMPSPTGPVPKGQTKQNPRKRGSQSSNLVSPALRPRISPSIKPLLPEGAGLSHDTHALLLASKSNYQNLLEGNQVPGVNYPSDLATNLTSKRTSHKIAEQGRRNRINTALQEMQSLLPPAMSSAAAKDSEGSPDDTPTPTEAKAKSGSKTPGTPAQGGNSKAATVELAIKYIKNLNGQLQDKESENQKLRNEMAALRLAAGMSPVIDSQSMTPTSPKLEPDVSDSAMEAELS